MNVISTESETHPGVYISTYGCQMNVNDTERMNSLLEMMNYRAVETPDEASLIIINSCSVREKPVHKVHSEVGRYKKLKGKNPALKIGVAGCVAQQEKSKLLSDLPILDFVLGPDNIDELPEIVSAITPKITFSAEIEPIATDLMEMSLRAPGPNAISSKTIRPKMTRAKFDHQRPYQIQTLVRNPGVATFVNITKGCDNFCTFCIVPFTRGRLRSRSLTELITDVKVLIDRGVKEVTLLGQNVNSYESSCGANFADLMRTLCEDTDIARIRYTTSHPKDFDQQLVDISAKYRSKICDYIHLPVQAGSTEILKRMNRGYSRDEYLAKIEMIKAGIPGVSLSTDVIVGFPGETEDDFRQTFELIQSVGYESIYAFKYSPRPFTKAARYHDQVLEADKSRRLTELLEMHREQVFENAPLAEGKTYEVLVESFNSESSVVTGRTTQNKVAHFLGSTEDIGKMIDVRINKAYPLTLYGERVGSLL
ncbi:MAG: tRNA (N6-isopentenyl adenosine(37)-C2)-methylthiotransferase MiaB [Bdellovibrionales bacterium CG10_big_fil_rev_8_21_14_0_10_45_34]|nr:MAG: tRNA (N6-isopentenyl adenosine(37)-C2)-methylthiotransferase MiaB [Bdellovibrionales bacterium CG10_big_fil_rev_8_21_14_0_10_45_34]